MTDFERMAKAIGDSMYPDSKGNWMDQNTISHAKEALESLMEPSEGVIDVGGESLSQDEQYLLSDDERFERGFKAAISHIISQGEE